MNPYVPPKILFNRHVETIYPSLFRKVEFNIPVTERLSTPDDDFLDLDWYRQNSEKCVIISHGLEGNSKRAYVTGMAKGLFGKGFDVLAWNYRGCSGEMNRQLRFYHSGATDDLHTVVLRAIQDYPSIYLIGFSLGGNLTLKYLGERTVTDFIKKSVAFSVPLDLHTSCLEISKPSNWIYSERFLRSLKKKVKEKAKVRNDLKIENLDQAKTLFQFDDLFTGPVHGFNGALDYYTRSSAIHFMNKIEVPTLVVNAQNDPFLSPNCFPESKSAHVKLEFPGHGGHVGFSRFGHNALYWSEVRAMEFLDS